MTPKVSVVMPVYNGERFVGEAVESILNQTFTDFELVAVDDGSTDHSLEILESYAARDQRVRVHRMAANGGAITARNTGTQLATGEFIAAMDADDVSLPNRLAAEAGYLSEHPNIGVVGAYVQLIDGDGRRGAIKTFPADPALMAWSMLFFNCLAHPVVMIRRGVFRAARGYAPECKGGAEDYDLFARVSRFTRLGTVPEVLLLYRKWEGNMTRLAWEVQEQDATRVARENAAAWLGEDVSNELGRGLRGLATGDYPRTSGDIRSLGTLITRLFRALVRQPGLTQLDQRRVARDAGIKLFLLASLASLRSPVLSASLAASAFAISPGALPSFVVKATKRLASRP